MHACISMLHGCSCASQADSVPSTIMCTAWLSVSHMLACMGWQMHCTFGQAMMRVHMRGDGCWCVSQSLVLVSWHTVKAAALTANVAQNAHSVG